jgi:hypothetical protein
MAAQAASMRRITARVSSLLLAFTFSTLLPATCLPELGGLKFCAQAAKESVLIGEDIELLITITNCSKAPILIFDYSKIPKSEQAHYLTVWPTAGQPPCTADERPEVKAEWFTLLQPSASVTYSVFFACPLPEGRYDLGVAIPYRSACSVTGVFEDKRLEALCSSKQKWQPPGVVFPILYPINVSITKGPK